MSVEIKVPTLGESITEATVAKWLKKEGDSFQIDEPLVEIETDKITLEVSAPSSGVLESIKVDAGKDVAVGGILGIINEQNVKANNDSNKKIDNNIKETNKDLKKVSENPSTKSRSISPSAKKLIEEKNIDTSKILSTAKEDHLSKSDVINYLNNNLSKTKKDKEKTELEEIVPMSKIRQTISLRLKEAQNTAAILTTFNEVDMSEIIKVRTMKKEVFEKEYGVKLGFMSFFVKAVINALNDFPAVNAEIREQNIIYKNYFHIGIAVGTENGLVVPIIKNADKLNFGETEKKILELSNKAKEGKLTMDDLSGGTFTISNGGVYGSMLSTPILNRPQSGILGMHNIKNRPVVVENKIVIRPIMYLAFSYDHRLIDGKEAVTFLVKIKELLEDPTQIILGI